MNDNTDTNEGPNPDSVAQIRDELKAKLDWDESSQRGTYVLGSLLGALTMGFGFGHWTASGNLVAAVFAVGGATTAWWSMRNLRRIKEARA